jgi:hypothetical protein
MVAAWAVLLAGVLAAPSLLPSANPGDDLTRNTVRLALAYYAAAAALMLRLRPGEWLAASGRGRLARWCWTLAWAAYLVHLGMALHYYDGWSHARAVERTERATHFGPGIYVSHAFSLFWTLDVLYWWLRPAGYAARPAWVGRLLHGFMALIIFCATVVYEEGFIRRAGLALFALLGAMLLSRLRRTDLQTVPLEGRFPP